MVRSKTLADEATAIYSAGKEFLYDHVQQAEVIKFAKNADTRLNIKVNPKRRSLKGILLLFVEPYTAGGKDSETFINADFTKVRITINGSPNRIYNEGISSKDIWEEVNCTFTKLANKTEHMILTKFYTGDKFGLLIDLRSMPDQTMYGSGMRLVNTKDGVHLEIERNGSGSGNVNCYVFTTSDSQMIP